MKGNIFSPHNIPVSNASRIISHTWKFLDFPCPTLEFILRGAALIHCSTCWPQDRTLPSWSTLKPNSSYWTSGCSVASFCGKQNTCNSLYEAVLTLIWMFLFNWVIKMNVAVTRRILLWCNQVTPCLCICLCIDQRVVRQASKACDYLNVNSHLMVLGQNVLGPHAWGESGEGPARSWCVGS